MTDLSQKTLTCTKILCLVLAPALASAGGFDLAEADRSPAAASAPRADWARAALLPEAISIAALEARRSAAANLDRLAIGPDGSVDLALSTVIDLTLRSNLDLAVDSYEPALSSETLRAREAIFDPLLRFTLSLLSSTNPTSASLAGASVLSIDQASWDAEVQRLIPWGGTASVAVNNQRQRSNNSFSTLNPSYDSSLSVALRQPLLRDFGKDLTRREIRIAENNQSSSAEAFRERVMIKVTDAIDAYWELYGRKDALAVQGEALRLAEDLLRINKTRVEVGTMAPLDVSAAEAEVARNEELLITAELALRNAEDRVRRLMNVPADSGLWAAPFRPIDSPEVSDTEIDVAEAIATAYRNRPDLRRVDLGVHNDEIRLDYAANQLKPGVSLEASYRLSGLGGTQIVRSDFGGDIVQRISGGYSDALDQLFSFDFETWRVAAVVELPVFNQLAQANRASALLALRRSEQSGEALKQAIAVEVRRLARAVRTSVKSAQAAGVTRSLQEKRLDAEQKKFEHGLSTNFAVTQAQKDLTEARTNEVLAFAGYRRALAAFGLATGTVLETHHVRIQD